MGITYPQYIVLLLLWEHDNRIISDITEQLHLETNTITPLLQRMEREGLIVRSKGLVDSRQRIISLTSKGKKLEEQAKDIPECLVNNLVDTNLTIDDIISITPLLDKLIDKLGK